MRIAPVASTPLVALLLASSSLVAALGEEAAQPKSDQEQIQGTWKCVATLKDGKQVNNFVGAIATIEGEGLTFVFTSKSVQKMTFKLDPTQNPKLFQWFPADKPGVKGGERYYVLADDTLVWCTNSPERRPESWNSGQWLFICQRVKDRTQ